MEIHIQIAAEYTKEGWGERGKRRECAVNEKFLYFSFCFSMQFYVLPFDFCYLYTNIYIFYKYLFYIYIYIHANF